jgi:polyisoprenyl-teichoic acid--peptidoglycan teichoic acid transferase
MHADNALMQRSSVLNIGSAWLVAAAVIGLLLAACTPNEPAATASPNPTAEPTPEPTASPTLSAELMDRPWNVLYVGIDLNERRRGENQPLNTDALMLVSLSADQSELTLVSLPRDTVDVPLPDGTVYPRKINGLYAEQGIEALVGAMETLYGVEIDGHVVLDMDDFANLVTAVDGVEVTLDEPLADPIVNLDLEAGTQMLDAAQALGYVRTRAADQDYGRMGRQQEVIVELVSRLVDPETDLDLMALLDGLASLETDLPLEELPTLVELASRAADAEVTSLVIQPPLILHEGDRQDGRGYILEPDVEAIRAEVQALIGE